MFNTSDSSVAAFAEHFDIADGRDPRIRCRMVRVRRRFNNRILGPHADNHHQHDQNADDVGRDVEERVLAGGFEVIVFFATHGMEEKSVVRR